MEIDREIFSLEKQLADLRDKKRQKQARMKFLCGCGKMHTIKDCSLIQSYWYERPHGCTDGDIWHIGEMAVICPDTNSKNRLFFDSNYNVEYFNRHSYEYSAEMQFRSIYSSLFKEIIEDYDKDRRNFWNNNYFDDHRARFGLHVKGIDK